MPSAWAAKATAAPWLPPDAATTPAAGTSRSSRLANAPRALNDPACCSCSSLSSSGPAGSPKSARSTLITGVRRTCGAISAWTSFTASADSSRVPVMPVSLLALPVSGMTVRALPCGEARHQAVHHTARVPRLHRVPVTAAGHHRADEQEQRRLHVSVLAQLAGDHAAAQHGPDHLAARLHPGLGVAVHQPGVPAALAEQERELAGPGRVGGLLGQRVQQRAQVLADRPAARLGKRCLHRRDRRQQQVLLAWPAPVDRALADPGPGGDLLDAQRVRAGLGEQLPGRRDDRPVGLLAARPSGTPLVLGGFPVGNLPGSAHTALTSPTSGSPAPGGPASGCPVPNSPVPNCSAPDCSAPDCPAPDCPS